MPIRSTPPFPLTIQQGFVMPNRQPAGANGQGDEGVLTINHKLMKIRLHTTAPRPAIYRVRLAPDGSFEVSERAYGSSWSELGALGLKDPVRTIIHDFLRVRDDHRFYFLYEEEIKPLLNRCDNRPSVR
jgi:hypothetical protein